MVWKCTITYDDRTLRTSDRDNRRNYRRFRVGKARGATGEGPKDDGNAAEEEEHDAVGAWMHRWGGETYDVCVESLMNIPHCRLKNG